MGVTGGARLGASRLRVGLAVALLVLATALVPAAATVYSDLYAGSTGTVQSPSLPLLAGTAGASTVSAVAPNAATLTTTASLTYYESANAATNSVSVDGSSSAATNGKKISLGVTLTTAQPDDVVYLAVSLPTGTPVTGVSDTSSLAWTLRQTEDANGVRIETWYAIAATPLPSDTVTISVSSASKFSATVMGVSGTNTAAPFDPRFAQAVVGTGSSSTGSVPVTTAASNDLLVAVVTAANGVAVTAVPPMTLVAPTQSPQETGAAETAAVTSVQASSPLAFALASAQGWVMIADAFSEAPPTVVADTSLAAPVTAGSFALPALSSAYLWSAAYTTSTTVYTGSWTVNLWGSGTTGGAINLALYVVDPANAVVATLLAAGSTGSFGTSQGEVVTVLPSVPGTTITAGDRVLLVLTAPSGGPGSFNIYWGASQLSSLMTPASFDYVLALSNPTGSPWGVSMGLASSGSVSRVGNLTIRLTEPAAAPYSLYSSQLAVSGGAITSSQGPTVTLAASTTMYIDVYASATSQGSSDFVVSLRIQDLGSGAYTSYTINLTVD